MPNKHKLRLLKPIFHHESLDRNRRQRPPAPRQLLVRTQKQQHMTPDKEIRFRPHGSLSLSRLDLLNGFIICVAHASVQVWVFDCTPVTEEFNSQHVDFYNVVIRVGKDPTVQNQRMSLVESTMRA